MGAETIYAEDLQEVRRPRTAHTVLAQPEPEAEGVAAMMKAAHRPSGGRA